MKKGFFLIILLAVLFLIAVTADFLLIWQVFFLAVSLGAVSLLWTLLNSRLIEADISPVSGPFQVEDSFEEVITIFNRSRLPRLLLRFQLSSNLKIQDDFITLSLPSRGSSKWRTRVNCPRRGRFNIGPITVTAGDPFGLFTWRRMMGKPQSIIVYPRTIDLPSFSIAQSESRYAGMSRIDSQSDTDISGIRESHTGDSLKHVHWPSTIHSGKLMVKLFEPERKRNHSKVVWILADMSESSHIQSVKQSTEEYTVTIAASLAAKYINEGWAVGFIGSGEQVPPIAPYAGEEHLSQILTVLAIAKADGSIPVDDFIANAGERFGSNCAVIIISPNTEQISVPLRQLAAHGHTVAAILLDKASFGAAPGPQYPVGGLTASGIQVHTIKSGDDLAKTLSNTTDMAGHVDKFPIGGTI